MRPETGNSDSHEPERPTTKRMGSPNTATAADMDARTIIEGTTPASDADTGFTLSDTIGKYEIRAQLGSGGMGAVYRAFDPMIEREVALKILSQDIANSEVALQRFLGEARAIGRLNHPHVVSIYDIGTWNGQYYLVMELLAGGSVADKLRQQSPLPWQDACRIISESAKGLAAAHATGIIHRDIKPENLMLTRDGIVKVVDFGLSKLIDSSQASQESITRVGQILGTPQYMSPEQFEAAETDARTDVYSLGATLFRLLTGQYPFGQCSSVVQVMTAHLTKAPPAPTVSVTGLPAACDQIVARAMAKKPADRYQSATDLAMELDALLHRPLPMAPPTPAPPEQTLRSLQNVVIIEPSKLQGTILKSAFSQAGVSTVQLCTGLEAARRTLTLAPPDLLLTAMQLSDGSGLEFLREFLRADSSSPTTVVLNSSDSTLAELTTAGQSACLILAPKKVRPEEIIRIAHAASPCSVHAGPLTQPLNPATLRLQIILDSGHIPESLADCIRDLQLLDVEVLTATESHSTTSATADLTLLVQSASSGSQSPDAAALALQCHASQSLCALLHSTGNQLRLRAVHRNDVIAVCNQPLDSHRLACLLQAARP